MSSLEEQKSPLPVSYAGADVAPIDWTHSPAPGF